MGLIGRLLQWATQSRRGEQLAQAEISRGGGRNITSPAFSAPGDDAQPLPGDYLAAVETFGNGRALVVGYSDPRNEKLAAPGEVRRYARDAAGDVVVTVFLRADGSARIFNGNGTFELREDGEVRINGARITRDGRIIDANGVSVDRHRHGGVQSGSTVTLRAQA